MERGYSGNSILCLPSCPKCRMNQPSDVNRNLVHARLIMLARVALSTVTPVASITEYSKTGTSYLNSSGVFDDVKILALEMGFNA
jgi:hypothetical protein